VALATKARTILAVQSPHSPRPVAGWYKDAANPSLERWWDGARWTEHTRVPPPGTSRTPQVRTGIVVVAVVALVAGALGLFMIGRPDTSAPDRNMLPAASAGVTAPDAGTPTASSSDPCSLLSAVNALGYQVENVQKKSEDVMAESAPEAGGRVQQCSASVYTGAQVWLAVTLGSYSDQADLEAKLQAFRTLWQAGVPTASFANHQVPGANSVTCVVGVSAPENCVAQIGDLVLVASGDRALGFIASAVPGLSNAR
jgi:hypothetical protein